MAEWQGRVWGASEPVSRCGDGTGRAQGKSSGLTWRGSQWIAELCALSLLTVLEQRAEG